MKKFLGSSVFAVFTGITGGVCAYFFGGKSLFLTIWTSGLPVLFKIFDKKIDKILTPVQKIKSKLPRILLFAAGLAIPFIVSYSLISIIYNMQLAVLLTTIICPFMTLVVTKPVKPAAPGKALAVTMLFVIMSVPLLLYSQEQKLTDLEQALEHRRKADAENDEYSVRFQKFVRKSKVIKAYYDREKQENVLKIRAELLAENDDYYSNTYSAVLIVYQNGKSLGMQYGNMIKEERITPAGEPNAQFYRTFDYTVRIKPEDYVDMYALAWHFQGNWANIYGLIKVDYRAVYSEPGFRDKFLGSLFSLLLTGLITLPQLLQLLQKRGYSQERIARVQEDFAARKKALDKKKANKYRDMSKTEFEGELAFYKKVNDWLLNHPEYSHLRSKIMNKQGFVDKEFFSRVWEHYRKHNDDPSASEYDTAFWVRQFFRDTSRELFTGVKADGKTSLKALMLRGIAGVATGSLSEWVYNTVDTGYRIKDAVDKDLTGIDLYWNIGKGVVKDAVTGYVAGKGIGKAIEFAGAVKNGTTQQFFRQLRDDAGNIVKKLRKPFKPGKIKPELSGDETAFLQRTLDTIESGDSKAMVQLYNNRKSLASIEAKGALDQDKVNKLVANVKKELNQVIDDATHQTLKELPQKAALKGEYSFKNNKVIIKEDFKLDVDELHRADFGRVSRKGYVDFDMDNTTYAKIAPDNIEQLKGKIQFIDQNGKTITPSSRDVHDFIQSRVSSVQEKNVQNLLKDKLGISSRDVEYGNYAGTKGLATADDVYPTSITENSIAQTQGNQVYTIRNGEVRSYQTSGRTLIDEQNLSIHKLSELEKNVKVDLSDKSLKIADKEWFSYLEEQKKAIFNKALNPDKYPTVELKIKPLTKAVDRMQTFARIKGQALSDERLVKLCSQIRNNTNRMAEILHNNGYTGETGMEDFVHEVAQMAGEYFNQFS